MTLTMADSITAANLPAGYNAYAGYVDGNWPDYPQIAAQFPSAHLLPITVTGATAATACDCENGDLTPSQAISWAQTRLNSSVWRPVIYADVSTMASSILPGLTMPQASVRLWSAHYGAGEHICGPSTCGLISVNMDGTQWTDTASGTNGSEIDASLLTSDFFTPTPTVDPFLEEDTMPKLSIGQGARDAFSFDGAPYVSIGFLSDPGGDGISETTVRVALHGEGKGAAWNVFTVTLTPATPKYGLGISGPNNGPYDGVVFTREDNGGAVGVNFA
jgi:hypothetical protein